MGPLKDQMPRSLYGLVPSYEITSAPSSLDSSPTSSSGIPSSVENIVTFRSFTILSQSSIGSSASGVSPSCCYGSGGEQASTSQSGTFKYPSPPGNGSVAPPAAVTDLDTGRVVIEVRIINLCRFKYMVAKVFIRQRFVFL